MPIIEDFLVNLAAGFTQTVLMTLGKRVLDDPQQRALICAYQVGFEAMLRTAGSGLSQAELSVVGDIIGRFLGQPTVATALLDLGLVGAPLDVSALATRWNDVGGTADIVNIRFDFGWGLLAFQQSLTAALIAEASRSNSPLANQVTVTRLVALQGQVGQILDLLRSGPTAAPPASTPLPATSAPPGPGTPAEPPPDAPPPASPPTSGVQPAAAAHYHSCFISYASKDQAFANRLYTDLCAAGVMCWYAPEDMAIGDRIRMTIYTAIGRLDKLLIILSRNSIASEWVEGEVERAFERERRQKETILFPIRLDDDVMDTDEAWAGDVRRTRHIGDFTRWNDAEAYDRALRRLLRDLEVGRGKQPTIPKPTSGSPLTLALHTMRTPFADFTGRDNDIKALVARLGQEGVATITGIRGMGGIGKTELALVVAQQLADCYPDAALQFELQPGNVPLTPEAMLGSVIHTFQPELRLPDGLAERQGLYRTALAGKQGLLLLDNAASPEQVRPLLPPPPGWAVLVTSRSRFPLSGALLHDLELLPLEDAIALLRRILSDGGRRDLVAADLAPLAERCGQLPLALRLAANFLTSYRDWTLPDYLAALERAPLAHLAAPGEALMQSVLKASIARLQECDAALVERWEQLAVFPVAFDRGAGAAVWGELSDVSAEDMHAWPELVPLAEEETRLGLSALVQQSLLECDAASGTYMMHDLLRECVLAAPSIDMNEARLRHAWHYLGLGREANKCYLQGGADVIAGLWQFEGTRQHLAAAWAQLRDKEDKAARQWLNAYPGAVANVWELRAMPRERIAVLEMAAQAACGLSDRWGEGNHLGNLGLAYTDLGEVRRAVSVFEKALAISRETRLGSAERSAVWVVARHAEGVDLSNLGIAHAQLGEVRKAIVFFEEALAINREIRAAFTEQSAAWTVARRGEGAVLGNLGLAYAALGETQRAIRLYDEQLLIAQEIGDLRREANALGNLGIAYKNLGKVRQAISFHEKALGIFREIADRGGEANALANMGLAYEILGEHEWARALWTDGLKVFEAIESPEAERVRERLERLSDDGSNLQRNK